jgi:hypothetical protein
MQENRLPSPIALRLTPGSATVRSGVAQVRHFLWDCYRSQPLRIVTFSLVLIYVSAVSLVILSCGGCASTVGFMVGGARIYNPHVYAPFDNARDWGPSYLVGPPDHRFGREPHAPTPYIAGSNSALLPSDGPIVSMGPRLPEQSSEDLSPCRLGKRAPFRHHSTARLSASDFTSKRCGDQSW